MRDGRVRRAAITAVAVGALCAITSGVSAAEPAAMPTRPIPVGASFVAMGSSFAAGYDISPQESGDGLCGRSFVDYAHLVAKKLQLRLDDVTCGGAVTANALNTAQDGHPPQIDAVTADTRLVTMTIGGNDVDYSGTSVTCGVTGPLCITATNRKAINADFKQLPHSLESLISAIRAKAPKVTIVLVTYPRLVPPTSCSALVYTPASARLVASIGSRLEEVFVKVAKATHIGLADPYVLGAKHGPCAGAKRWIAGLVPSNGAPYHPTAAGHREMARLVEQALARG